MVPRLLSLRWITVLLCGNSIDSKIEIVTRGGFGVMQPKKRHVSSYRHELASHLEHTVRRLRL